MSKDLEIIKEIEKIIGKKLKPMPLEKIIESINNGYFQDEAGNVIGLNLDKNNLSDISFLQELSHLTHLSLYNNKIIDSSPLKKLTHLKALNLSSNQISDINPIKELNNLQSLDLQSNQISDIRPVKELNNLQSLDLSFNQISDISHIKELTNLKELNLSSNRITDFSPIIELKNLQTLSLSSNQIADINFLKELTNIQTLSLSYNQISDISPIKKLTNLESLSLSSNQISDLSPIKYLTNLQTLDFDSNRITDISPAKKLINLQSLNLNSNQISDISPIKALQNLKELYLSSNQISDLSPIKELTGLKGLYLQSNQISDISPIKQLINLETLDLRNNQINRLSPETTEWWPNIKITYSTSGRPDELNLFGNPLVTPPIEIVKRGRKAIQNYFDELKQSPVLFLESKLLIVGNGEVGKTTLMRKLTEPGFKVDIGKEDTTRGINIKPWQMSCDFKENGQHDVKIHFWDFGGQEILHATHQFFLTKRSLYIFVWEARKEEEQIFDYWLNVVKLLSNNSPVIVVMNKSELRTKEIAENALRAKFSALKEFLKVSCVTGENISKLTDSICFNLSQMPHLLDKLPKRWLDIRNRLQTIESNYISLDEYLRTCHFQGMDEEKALFLSDYLHDLGIILHFRTDPLLIDTIILKPEWATSAVYALIENLEIQKAKGKFNRLKLKNYWNRLKFPVDKHSLLLRLMEKFELCFNIVGTDDYIIPELLPAERKDINFESYKSSGNLHLIYTYEFMPAGIVTRFITRLHYLIKEDHYWKNGVELHFNGASALISGDSVKKRIEISVSGNSPAQLMAIIRSHFDHIHETLNMKKNEHVFEEIPCICTECIASIEPHYFKNQTLQKFISKGRKTAICEKSAEDVSIDELLNGLKPLQKTENLFDTLITTVLQLQERSKALQPDENSRNSFLTLLINSRGYKVKDQTLSGRSATGKKLGEIDIKIEDDRGRTVSIIEALNLDSLNRQYLDFHIIKLLSKYNCSGLQELYILVYASVNSFSDFYGKYWDHLSVIHYGSYPLKDRKSIVKISTGYNKIKVYRTIHKCNDEETLLNHILVEM